MIPRRPAALGSILRAPVLLLFFLALAAGFASPGSVSAQVEEALTQAELEFEAAVRERQSALAARAAVERRFTSFTQEAEDARRQGDSDRLEEALASAQAQLVELRRLDRRVAQTEERLEESRGAYLQAMDDRIEALLVEARTVTPEERGAILVIVEDLNNRVREVESGSDLTATLLTPVMPEVQFDPRDGPIELRAKAELLERQAERYDSLMAEVDDRLEELERRVRRDQLLRDFREGLDRFGDTQLPVRPPAVTPPGAAEEQLAQADSIPDQESLTPEDRIELLLFFRTELESTRDQLLVRARLFRDRAGGGTYA